MSRSPIERMIDAACGITEADRVEMRRGQITMKCRSCGDTRSAARDASDPPGADTIVFPCPNCRTEPWPDPVCLDVEGREIAFDMKG